MTKDELKALLNARTAAWDELGHHHGFLGEMSPVARGRVDDASRRFHAADRAIVAELSKRPGPVPLGGVVLHLTQDRMHFAILPADGPRPGNSNGACVPSLGMLYDYPGSRPSRQRVPSR